ncbi:phage tail domain-containing protein [Staphylococcus pseudoxylosus]|uniref:Phage tail family protein n=1 Tax=Staphylococcus pseudoxylosus TaxID=2282419 RepID=A0AAQ0MIQ8_9STAP|nr:phage tail domain-containing protein [Staphylococcus pseudoxylosus]MCE5003197.1 phage tail family protein [Staphylococcus pseudoxylosus]RMI85012.1 phage tail family protein [Staphylococcus pseudoxylosus]
MKQTVRMFNDNFDYMITDLPYLKVFDYKEEDVDVRTNTLEIKGRDGVLVGPSTFGPFKLILRFYYKGHDLNDYNLMKEKMRGLLFRREPYYIVHSFMPGKKYAVQCEGNAITDVGTKAGEFEVTFNVYKGFSESLRDTLDVNFLTDYWQFEGGLITDREISYKHTNKRFEIWNGSYDKIDPLHHKLIIRIKANAPNGFKMTNHMTGQTFIYSGALKEYQILTINGVHPILDSERVGINTNWEWIELLPGFNNIEIEGNGLTKITTEFQFDFIYR